MNQLGIFNIGLCALVIAMGACSGTSGGRRTLGNTGGNSSQPAATGGNASTGGMTSGSTKSSTGGNGTNDALGGVASTGGTFTNNAQTGGVSATGGISPTGGSSVGGTEGTGGTLATGGMTSTGGAVGGNVGSTTGGAMSIGGMSSTGEGGTATYLNRRTYIGKLNSNGEASVVAPEIKFADMPLTIGYVYSKSYATPGYVELGNIIPEEGVFSFSAGALNSGADYIVVTLASSENLVMSGMLDATGMANVSVPDIKVSALPLVLGYVYTTAYARPGYVPLGNIIPNNGSFVFSAGAANAGAKFILVVLASSANSIIPGTLDTNGAANVVVPEITLGDMPFVLGYVYTTGYAMPGFVTLGSIIPNDGLLVFSAGAANANAAFQVVLRH